MNGTNYCSKRRELFKIREKELKEKEELTLRIQRYGLWTTSSEVETQLALLKNKKAKLDTLKIQLHFRKKVLNQQVHDKILFQFSHDHKTFTVEELAQNLCTILSSTLLIDAYNSESSGLKFEDVLKGPELLLYSHVQIRFRVLEQ